MVRIISTLICFLYLSQVATAQEELVDRILAVVNDEPILHSEVQAKVDSGFVVAISYYPAPEDASMFEKALQDSVNFELVMQKAEELEIEINDSEVESQIQQTLQYRRMTRENLMNQLSSAGLSYEQYKDDVRKQMIFARFRGMVIRPLIKITEKDIETYYLKKSGSTAENIRLTLRQILFSVPSKANDAVMDGKFKLAKEVYQKLEGGFDFVEAVKVYSDAPGAKTNGGLMSDIKLNDLTESIRTKVSQLETGGFTQPIKTALGYHIFLLEGKKFSGSDEFKQQKAALENELFASESEVQTVRWLMENRGKVDIKLIR